MTTTMVHVIGKCPVKGCAHRRRNSFPGRVEQTRYGKRTHWGMPTTQGLQFPTPSIGGSLARPSIYPTNRGGQQAWLDAMRENGWVCTEHDRFCAIAVVQGVVNTEKTCNARCEAATGSDCECSCGGELHGSAHA